MITIQVEPQATKDDAVTVMEIVRSFNQQFFAPTQWRSVTVLARDETGAIVGGALGDIGCGWLYLSVLGVREDWRRQGIGTALLQAVEQEAQTQGSIGVYLETIEFQAPEFYQRNGYSIYAVQENYPVGFKRYYLQKLFPPLSRTLHPIST
jgi:GNAT superfamily N-acetyltransferase